MFKLAAVTVTCRMQYFPVQEKSRKMMTAFEWKWASIHQEDELVTADASMEHYGIYSIIEQ